MKVFRLFVLAAATFGLASVASAQVAETGRAGIVRRNLVSANPVGLLFEWYNGEYERAISNTASLAVAASTFDFWDDDARYTAVDGIARYYPQGRALRGFSVGASVGIVDVGEPELCAGCEDDSGTSATLGIRGDYVWIIGRDQVFAVATGVGAKRILANDIGTEFIPIGRLSIGYAW